MGQCLSDLLAPWFNLPQSLNVDIETIVSHSNMVQSGVALISVINNSVLETKVIEEALTKKATAIILDGKNFHCEKQAESILVRVPSLREKIAKIAGNFFSINFAKLKLIGVTGTNGKTSLSQYIAQLLHYLDCSCGVIGTLGNGFLPHLDFSGLTTPDTISLHRVIYEQQKQGAQVIAMEVSSHALEQLRVQGLQFSQAVFSNLTRDHLDYHISMQAYANAKLKLFVDYQPEQIILNLDDSFSQEIIKKIKHDAKIFGYGFQYCAFLPRDQQIIAQNVIENEFGIQAEILSPWGIYPLRSSLLGKFNLYNLLAAITALVLQGFSIERIFSFLPNVKAVPGRMQALHFIPYPKVIIDFAHTPDALEKILQAVKPYTQGQIWCVFGCGGDRDRGKRPLMAAIAEKYADHLILTDDNPRTENPEQIIQDMLVGLNRNIPIKIIHQREQAIKFAMTQAKQNDLIILAGKGHEDYQIIGERKYSFSDAEWVTKIATGVSE